MGKPIKAELFHPEDLPTDLLQELNNAPDHLYMKEHRIYLLMNGTVICCEEDDAGRELISSFLHGINSPKRSAGREGIYESILKDPYFVPDEEMLRKNRISSAAQRCAIVFQAFLPIKADFSSAFDSIVPIEENDTIVHYGYRSVVLIKAIQSATTEELTEYSDAVIGSMETEGFSGIKAGIGCSVSEVVRIRESYLEACKALNLGMRYHSHERVYVYSRQTLEKIVDCIPPEKKKELIRQFFRIGTESALSDELLETVRVFFQNDLNLTAASRQLFIHRNTLNYRLDKIKKDFGLDLRSFHDAVIFKLLSEISDKP